MCAWQRGTIVYVGFRYLTSRLLKLLYSAANLCIIRGQQISIQKPFLINGLLHCQNDGAITIGENILINSGIDHNPIGGDSGTWLCTKATGSIVIGNSVRISNSTVFSALSVVIKDNVFIGGSCKIYDTDFHPLIPQLRLSKETSNDGTSREVYIGANSFIGAHSIILKGSSIGDSSVIGAGSVVSGTIPPAEIWAGNPARFLKKL